MLRVNTISSIIYVFQKYRAMIYRVCVLIINILITISLLVVCYKPSIIKSVKLKLLTQLEQYKMAQVVEQPNIDKILDILISIAKLQTYNQNLIIAKISYQNKTNQMTIVVNSQDLDIINQYTSAISKSLRNNAHVAMMQTVDNTAQDLLQNYYKESASQDITNLRDKDSDTINFDDSFVQDFSYTTIVKITL
jgi:hypothetical protein